MTATSHHLYDDCCHGCRTERLRDADFTTRISVGMLLCSTCGNKRCPHANDHDNACTASNEPGQSGSAYPTVGVSAGPLLEQLRDL